MNRPDKSPVAQFSTLGHMKTIVIILLCLLAVWWGLLTVHTIVCHRRRIQLAATWTPEDEKDYGRLRDSDPMIRAFSAKHRFVDYLLMSPFMFMLLPYFIYGRFVKDPFDGKHDHVA
jgi:hypothetical protein